MDKLTIEHLAAYLPYKVDFIASKWNMHFAKYQDISNTLDCIELFNILEEYEDVKLFLRPLSSLSTQIEHNGEKFVSKEWLYYNYIGEQMGTNIGTWSFRLVQKLLSWHFDIFGLIEKGLAIDIKEVLNA